MCHDGNCMSQLLVLFLVGKSTLQHSSCFLFYGRELAAQHRMTDSGIPRSIRLRSYHLRFDLRITYIPRLGRYLAQERSSSDTR